MSETTTKCRIRINAWTHPRTGEVRLYQNGGAFRGKAWYVKQGDRAEINWKEDYNEGTFGRVDWMDEDCKELAEAITGDPFGQPTWAQLLAYMEAGS